MSLINLAPINDGDDANSVLFNARFAAISDLLNGNVDSDNLTTNAVTTPKIVDQAVTEVKIAPKSVTGTKLVQPSILAYRSGDVVESGNVWRKITIDGSSINMGGFTLSNGGIMVPIAGIYKFSLIVSIQDRNPTNAGILPSISLDAGGPGRWIRGNPLENPGGNMIEDMFDLAANQIVYFWVYVATSNNYRFIGFGVSGDRNYVLGELKAAK